MKRKIKWTRENCILEAKKYKNVADWQKGNRSSYVSAINLGILDECKLYLEKKYGLAHELGHLGFKKQPQHFLQKFFLAG